MSPSVSIKDSGRPPICIFSRSFYYEINGVQIHQHLDMQVPLCRLFSLPSVRIYERYKLTNSAEIDGYGRYVAHTNMFDWEITVLW